MFSAYLSSQSTPECRILQVKFQNFFPGYNPRTLIAGGSDLLFAPSPSTAVRGSRAPGSAVPTPYSKTHCFPPGKNPAGVHVCSCISRLDKDR